MKPLPFSLTEYPNVTSQQLWHTPNASLFWWSWTLSSKTSSLKILGLGQWLNTLWSTMELWHRNLSQSKHFCIYEKKLYRIPGQKVMQPTLRQEEVSMTNVSHVEHSAFTKWDPLCIHKYHWSTIQQKNYEFQTLNKIHVIQSNGKRWEDREECKWLKTKKKKKENITSAPKQGNLNTPEQQSNVELLTLDEARAGSREDYRDINEFQLSAEP